MPKYEEHDETCQKSSEDKGMGKAAMAPKVAVTDAETKADDIHIRNDRTENSEHPDSLWGARLVETGSNAESYHRVREK